MTAEQARLMTLRYTHPNGIEDCEDCADARGLCWEHELDLMEPPC